MFARKIFLRFCDPSLEMLEAKLSRGLNRFVVCNVLSDEVVRIPSVDGIGVGSRLLIGGDKKGVVVHFDKNFATVAVGTNVAVGEAVTRVDEKPFKFSVPPVEFDCQASPNPGSLLTTGIAEVDFLLNVSEGQTVGIYNGAHYDKTLATAFYFPKDKNASGTELYLELISLANDAVSASRTAPVLLRLDLRGMESVFHSLQFQAGHPLPISPNALVASILQLSHKPSARSCGLSVVAAFDSEESFGGEATQSVDVQVALNNSGFVDNWQSLVGMHRRDDELMTKLSEGFRKSSNIQRQEEAGIFVDYWEKEEIDSFNTMVKILPHAAKFFQNNPQTKTVLIRALTVLFFNKTTKLDQLSIAKFPQQVVDLIDPNSESIDRELLRHRNSFELTRVA